MLQNVQADSAPVSRAELRNTHAAAPGIQNPGAPGICGWADPHNAARPGVVERMAARIARTSDLQTRSASTTGGSLALSMRANNGDVFANAEVAVAVSGRIRFSDAALARLAKEAGSARALAEGYSQRGTGIFERLGGAFEIAIISRGGREALLAIDRMGIGSLCYESIGPAFAFGSSLDTLGAFPGSSDEISLQSIYDYVHFHVIPAPQTIYASRRRLLPGTYVQYKDGAVRSVPYWQMRFVEDERRSFAELKSEFLGILRRSVADMATDGPVGAFLSGGTDSSTVTGMLREVTGEAPRTYSIGFDAEGFDEMHYARIAARHFGARHHEYYVTPDDVASAIPAIAASHDQPFGNSSAIPSFYCAKLSKREGVRCLLAGDGGDELFGGNSRYATQYLYSLYGDLPELLRKRALEPAVSLLPGIGLVGKAQRYMKHASIPMPARYDLYNFLRRFGPQSVFAPGFLCGVKTDGPDIQVEEAYRSASSASPINRMLALDWKYTLGANDLPKVTTACELAGLDVGFPLLDEELVQFASRLPPDHKVRRTTLRYFFKKALADFLPPEILSKTKHGFGVPVGLWLDSQPRLRDVAMDSLSSLRRTKLFRSAFLDELTAVHIKQHANYYGTMVWVLVMFEQWLTRHQVRQD